MLNYAPLPVVICFTIILTFGETWKSIQVDSTLENVDSFIYRIQAGRHQHCEASYFESVSHKHIDPLRV